MTTTLERPTTVGIPQYSRTAIVAIWAAAALPIGLLSWVVAPLLAHVMDGPNALVRALLLTLTAGLVWQGLLVLGLVWREQRSLRWSVLREALWLRPPRSPRTGRVGGRVWWIVLPLTVAFAAEELVPSLPHPVGRDFALFVESAAGHSFLHGAWGWYALLLVMWLFNTVLGEELLFRGFLLPRMNGAFGKHDWVVNGLLFAAYHLHVPWVIPATLCDTVILAYPSKRYRSALVGIAVHSTQSLVFAGLALSLVLGG